MILKCEVCGCVDELPDTNEEEIIDLDEFVCLCEDCCNKFLEATA